MTLDRGGGLRQFRVRFRFCAVAPRILRFHRMATRRIDEGLNWGEGACLRARTGNA